MKGRKDKHEIEIRLNPNFYEVRSHMLWYQGERPLRKSKPVSYKSLITLWYTIFTKTWLDYSRIVQFNFIQYYVARGNVTRKLKKRDVYVTFLFMGVILYAGAKKRAFQTNKWTPSFFIATTYVHESSWRAFGGNNSVYQKGIPTFFLNKNSYISISIMVNRRFRPGSIKCKSCK